MTHFAVVQINQLKEDLQDRERELSETQQKVIILDGELEASQETVDRLEASLNNYKQKFTTVTDDMSHLEVKYSQIQEQLAETRNRVG